MARYITARQVGEQLGLEHLEVIRRIRRKDIKARKFGWNWAIEAEEVNRVKQSDWYKKVMERRAARAGS